MDGLKRADELTEFSGTANIMSIGADAMKSLKRVDDLASGADELAGGVKGVDELAGRANVSKAQKRLSLLQKFKKSADKAVGGIQKAVSSKTVDPGVLARNIAKSEDLSEFSDDFAKLLKQGDVDNAVRIAYMLLDDNVSDGLKKLNQLGKKIDSESGEKFIKKLSERMNVLEGKITELDAIEFSKFSKLYNNPPSNWKKFMKYVSSDKAKYLTAIAGLSIGAIIALDYYSKLNDDNVKKNRAKCLNYCVPTNWTDYKGAGYGGNIEFDSLENVNKIGYMDINKAKQKVLAFYDQDEVSKWNWDKQVYCPAPKYETGKDEEDKDTFKLTEEPKDCIKFCKDECKEAHPNRNSFPFGLEDIIDFLKGGGFLGQLLKGGGSDMLYYMVILVLFIAVFYYIVD